MVKTNNSPKSSLPVSQVNARSSACVLSEIMDNRAIAIPRAQLKSERELKPKGRRVLLLHTATISHKTRFLFYYYTSAPRAREQKQIAPKESSLSSINILYFHREGHFSGAIPRLFLSGINTSICIYIQNTQMIFLFKN